MRSSGIEAEWIDGMRGALFCHIHTHTEKMTENEVSSSKRVHQEERRNVSRGVSTELFAWTLASDTYSTWFLHSLVCFGASSEAAVTSECGKQPASVHPNGIQYVSCSILIRFPILILVFMCGNQLSSHADVSKSCKYRKWIHELHQCLRCHCQSVSRFQRLGKSGFRSTWQRPDSLKEAVSCSFATCAKAQ